MKNLGLRWAAALPAVAMLFGASCQGVDRPRRALPETFSATLLDGGTVDRATLAGTPTVIGLWVPGCGACAKDLPALMDAYAHEGEGIRLVLVSLEPDESLVRSAAKKMALSGDVALANGEILAPLSVRGVPSTVFVDADGQMTAAATGVRTESFFRARLRELR